jgi:hypothetical protein
LSVNFGRKRFSYNRLQISDDESAFFGDGAVIVLLDDEGREHVWSGRVEKGGVLGKNLYNLRLLGNRVIKDHLLKYFIINKHVLKF